MAHKWSRIIFIPIKRILERQPYHHSLINHFRNQVPSAPRNLRAFQLVAHFFFFLFFLHWFQNTLSSHQKTVFPHYLFFKWKSTSKNNLKSIIFLQQQNSFTPPHTCSTAFLQSPSARHMIGQERMTAATNPERSRVLGTGSSDCVLSALEDWTNDQSQLKTFWPPGDTRGMEPVPKTHLTATGQSAFVRAPPQLWQNTIVRRKQFKEVKW